MSLFEQVEARHRDAAKPLAARLRPRNLDEFFGQSLLVGSGKLLRQLMEADRIGSVIFFGPPGTGKTTLARIIANETKREFASLNAVMHGVKELREVLQQARTNLEATGQGMLLFVDEIHRFNRAQQDAMLSDVEEGVISLIGATTSNPSFAVNNALISRSQLFQFEPLAEADLKRLIQHALTDPERGLGKSRAALTDAAIDQLCQLADGDARKVLSILETAVVVAKADGVASLNHSKERPSPADSQEKPAERDPTIVIDVDQILAAAGSRAYQYDRSGEEHYDCASALIKSIRGSDPDAGLYWLARMLEGGEEIRFLCRRLIILASEDIGNADPQALNLAVACWQACEMIGLPECQLTLSQTVAYLACAPKSNAATTAIAAARRDVRQQSVLPVPRHLRDSHYRAAKSLGHGVGYQYAHDDPDGITSQDYLGVERRYYEPVDRGFESELKQRLVSIRKRLAGMDHVNDNVLGEISDDVS